MPIVRGGYGYSTYSSGDFGTEGVVKDASVAIAATATSVFAGGKQLSSDATASASAGGTVSALRSRTSGGTSAAIASVACNAEKFYLELSTSVEYGMGLYGVNTYNEYNAQIVSIGVSTTAVANPTRVRDASASVSAISSVTSVDAEQISLGSATASASASTSATAVYSIVVAVSSSAEATTSISYIRKRNTDSIVSAESATFAIGREKWEPITNDTNTWTTIAESSNTWTNIAA